MKPAPPLTVVYVATQSSNDRFVGVSASLDGAKGLAEAYAQPYFDDTIIWQPIAPRHTGERQWIGLVIVAPRHHTVEYCVVETVLDDPIKS